MNEAPDCPPQWYIDLSFLCLANRQRHCAFYISGIECNRYGMTSGHYAGVNDFELDILKVRARGKRPVSKFGTQAISRQSTE